MCDQSTCTLTRVVAKVLNSASGSGAGSSTNSGLFRERTDDTWPAQSVSPVVEEARAENRTAKTAIESILGKVGRSGDWPLRLLFVLKLSKNALRS